MRPQPDSAKFDSYVDTWAQARAEALTMALAKARKQAQSLARAQWGARARLHERAEARAEARVDAWEYWEPEVQAEAQAEAQAKAEMEALAEALAEAEVLAEMLARTEAQARAEARARVHARLELKPTAHTAYTLTHDEILADSNLKHIIYSIKPYHCRSLARILWHPSQEFWWLIQIITPITRLPPELLHQIFLLIIDEANDSPLVLMLVCKLWYTVVTGIWASLELGTRTPKDAVTSKLKKNQWLLDVLVDTEIDRDHFTSSEGPYEAMFAAIEAASRWRSLVVETFPVQADLPEDLVNRSLRRSSGAVMSRLRTFKIKCACEMSPLLDHLLRILGTSASGELTTVEINSANVISFLVPTYSSIFSSVTVLTLDTPGQRNPVDLLPHLHQLETLTASHLLLPVHHSAVNIPFVHTLRHLTLRSVSIQWMSGRTFHVLESCTLIFPIHRHALHTFHTTLPNCRDLIFEGYPLNILDGVSARRLTHLFVVCSASYKPRGNQQLVRFSRQVLRESRLAPRILHISIEATSGAWTKAFAFMSNLEELVIDNAQPSSLGVAVLQSLVVHSVHANNPGATATPGGWNTPMCLSLKRFGLRYRRWLRLSEHFDLIPVFIAIIRSRQQSKISLQSFRIWTRGDPLDPLDLIEGSRLSPKGFKRLAEDCTIKEGNLL
jgi:hypothetical protein